MNSKKLLKIFRKNVKYVNKKTLYFDLMSGTIKIFRFDLSIDGFYFELRKKMEYDYETIVIKEKKWWMCSPHTQQKRTEKGFKYEINFQNKSYEITESDYNEINLLYEEYHNKELKKKLKKLSM